MNRATCHGCDNHSKLLFTWELKDDILKIETICRSCRSKEIVSINITTGIAEHKTISYTTFRELRQRTQRSTF